MKKIQLVDCTLRDGGYVNDWEFGHSNITCIFDRLVRAGIDIIEIGFLDERRPYDVNRTIQPDTSCYDKIFAGSDKGNSMVVAMIDYGTCSIDHLAACDETIIDGIRIIFKKPKMKQAVEFAHLVKQKGYKVFLQLVSITSYGDRDILDLVDMINELDPYAVSMVDTYGLMHKEEMLHYFHLLQRNLNPDIKVGYHSHNNFQLGYANEIEMLHKTSDRTLVVDGTVYGMGKSAGNAPLELLAMHLNENYGKNYDLDQILEIIDVNIMRIYKEHYWGYSLLFFLAASNDCHPNYIDYLLNKHTLSIKAINNIASMIRPESKLDYDKVYIEELYRQYQEKTIFESDTVAQLREELSGKNILLLGPGSSLSADRTLINSRINSSSPVVISVNCVPAEYNVDYIFMGNAKRYSMLYQNIKDCGCKIIATSNISSVCEPFDYVFSYDTLRDENPIIQDNGFIMAIKALIRIGIKEVTLAGFDGFSAKSSDNYYEKYMNFTTDSDYLMEVNKEVKAKLAEFKTDISIEFLTKSIYNE